jgi:hypothetical protein
LNPAISRPSTSAAITQRKNGTDAGTLKTRISVLIRDQAHHGTGGLAVEFVIRHARA